MPNKNSIPLRINKIITELFNGNKSEFARTIGISESSVRSYLANTIPKADVLEKIAEKIAISCEWLVLGRGDMIAQPNNENNHSIERYEEIIAAKNEVIALKDSIISRSDRLTEALEHRIKELESKLSAYEVEGLGSALSVGQYTLSTPGLPIKK